MNKQNLVNTIYRWRVRCGLLAIILALILANPRLYSLVAGIILCTGGLLIRVWACGHLQKEDKLTTSGPYRYSRNPLYLGNLIIGLSVVIGAYSWWVLVIFIFYFGLFYPIVIDKEKKKMEKKFPQEYKNYQKKVPVFFPASKPHLKEEREKFSWIIFKKNKEFRALGGALIFWIIMWIKYSFFS